MPDATVPFERILAPIPPGVRKDNEYAADGSGRDYAYDYFEIEEARRAVEVDKPRGDESDEMRQRAQPVARPADWGRVFTLGVAALTNESKDLTVAAWVVEALGHLRGFAGLRDGFALFRRLQGRYPDSSFPRDPDDPRVRRGPYEFLDGERSLPYLIRSLPLAIPDRGEGLSLLHRREADRNDQRLQELLRAGEDADDFEAGRLLPKDWQAAVEQTPDATLQRLAGEVAACLIAFRAWDRATDRLFRDVVPAPDLSRIGGALVDCAEEVARLQPDPGHPHAEALALALCRYEGGRPPAPSRPEPVVEDEPMPDEPPDMAEPEPERAPRPGPEASRPAARSAASTATPAPAAARPVEDAESARRQVREAAAFLRREDPRDPAPYLLVRSLRLGGLFGAADAGDDPPPAPASETRRELRRRVAGDDWDEVLDLTEEHLARPEGRGWLDAHRLSIRALEELGRDEAARACRGLLASALGQAPHLIDAELDDGTAAASAETRAWLANLLGPAPAAASTPIEDNRPVAAEVEDEEAPAPTDNVAEAEALLRAGRDDEAVAALDVALDAAPSGRARFLAAVRFAEACRAEGADRMASTLLEGLLGEADVAILRAWEGRAFFARAASLLRDALARLDDASAADRLARARARLASLSPAAGLRRDPD